LARRDDALRRKLLEDLLEHFERQAARSLGTLALQRFTMKRVLGADVADACDHGNQHKQRRGQGDEAGNRRIAAAPTAQTLHITDPPRLNRTILQKTLQVILQFLRRLIAAGPAPGARLLVYRPPAPRAATGP